MGSAFTGVFYLFLCTVPGNGFQALKSVLYWYYGLGLLLFCTRRGKMDRCVYLLSNAEKYTPFVRGGYGRNRYSFVSYAAVHYFFRDIQVVCEDVRRLGWVKISLSAFGSRNWVLLVL